MCFIFNFLLILKTKMKEYSKKSSINSKVSIHSFKVENSIINERKNCIDKLDELINNFISNKTNKVK